MKLNVICLPPAFKKICTFLSALKFFRVDCQGSVLSRRVLEVKVKENFTVEQATKTQSGGRGIALLFP
jgi:hypothetical protein